MRRRHWPSHLVFRQYSGQQYHADRYLHQDGGVQQKPIVNFHSLGFSCKVLPEQRGIHQADEVAVEVVKYYENP